MPSPLPAAASPPLGLPDGAIPPTASRRASMSDLRSLPASEDGPPADAPPAADPPPLICAISALIAFDRNDAFSDELSLALTSPRSALTPDMSMSPPAPFEDPDDPEEGADAVWTGYFFAISASNEERKSST